MKYFYQKESKEILDELNTTTSGLNSKEVEKRQEKHGLNVLPEAPRPSGFQIFLNQFKDLIVLILILVTTACPLPYVTCEPVKTMFVWSPTTTSPSTTSVFLSTA